MKKIFLIAIACWMGITCFGQTDVQMSFDEDKTYFIRFSGDRYLGVKDGKLDYGSISFGDVLDLSHQWKFKQTGTGLSIQNVQTKDYLCENYLCSQEVSTIQIKQLSGVNGITLFINGKGFSKERRWYPPSSDRSFEQYYKNIIDRFGFIIEPTDIKTIFEQTTEVNDLPLDFTYQILNDKNKNNDNILGRAGQFWHKSNADKIYEYVFTPLGNGLYKIGNKNTNLALTMWSTGIGDGNYGNNGYWKIRKTNDGYYIFFNVEQQKYIGVDGPNRRTSPLGEDSPIEDMKLKLYGQKEIVTLPSNSAFQITPKFNSNLTIGVDDDSKDNGRGILLASKNVNNTAQQFKIISLSNGYYKIINENSKKALCVFGAIPSEGTQNHQYDYSATNVGDQDWKLYQVYTGGYAFINRQSGLALSLENNSTIAGTRLVQLPFTSADNQLFNLEKVTPPFIKNEPILDAQNTKIENTIAQNNNTLNLSDNTVLTSDFQTAMSQLESSLSFGLLSSLGGMQVTSLEHHEGNNSGLGLTDDAGFMYPTTVIKGSTSFLGDQVHVEAQFSVGLSQPYVTLILTYANQSGQNAFSLENHFSFINSIPGMSGGIPGGDINLEDLKIVFTNYYHTNDADYGFEWKNGVNFLGKVYFNKSGKANTSNEYLIDIADVLNCDEFKMHLAFDISSGLNILAEVEAVTELPLYPISNYNLVNKSTGSTTHETLVFNQNEDFTIKVVSFGGSIELNTTEAELELGGTAQVQLAFDEPFADRGGKKTVLQFKGNPKITIAEPPTLSLAVSFEKAGFSNDGTLLDNGGPWKNPFGIPDSEILNAALQLGVTPQPPYISEFGIAGAGKVFGITSQFGFYINTTDPSKFIGMFTIDSLHASRAIPCLLGGGFPGLAAGYAVQQNMPPKFNDFIDNTFDAYLKDLNLTVITTPGKIGEIQFNNKGFTLNGAADLWGWESYIHMHFDDQNGLDFSSYIDPFTWDINGMTVFGLEGIDGNQDYMTVYEFDENSYAWTSKERFVGNNPHLNFTIPVNSTSDNFKMGMHANITLFNEEIPIDFDVDANLELVADFKYDFGGSSYIQGDISLTPSKFVMNGKFHLEMPPINIASFEVGKVKFSGIQITNFGATLDDSRVTIEPFEASYIIDFGEFDLTANINGSGAQTVRVPGFTVESPLNYISDLEGLVKDFIENNASSIFSSFSTAIDDALFQSELIDEYKIVFYEGDDCTQANYAWKELGNGYAQVNLKQNAPIAAIPDNNSSILFETILSTKNDEIRSFKVLPGNQWFEIRLYDNPDGQENDDWVKVKYEDKYFRSVCYTMERSNANSGDVFIEKHPKNGLSGKASLQNSINSISLLSYAKLVLTGFVFSCSSLILAV